MGFDVILIQNICVSDPVCADDGFTYEKKVLEDWLNHPLNFRRISPRTKKKINHIFPNRAIQKLVEAYKEHRLKEEMDSVLKCPITCELFRCVFHSY